MNADELVALAREAGLPTYNPKGIPTKLEHFAALVAAAEREACAKVCDVEFAACWNASAMGQAKEAKRCAAAIRARSEK